MKSIIIRLFAVGAVFCLSSYKNKFIPYLTVENGVIINSTNVTSSSSYTISGLLCFSTPIYPCRLDLGLIDPSYHVIDENSFINYLNTEFISPVARVWEVERITVVKKAL